MSYDTLRHLADSWGLVMMGVLFTTFVGWTFLPAARRSHQRAATSIFEKEDGIDG
ncbi:cytochrome c oxidase cbb3-type subunit 4 [Sphingomonas gellani]|uniref:Cytochrome c oxidase cbb3-type subunit 4 n=1 Tax=Sphingomonas gellani TaxID=1166340 RepID=A0A1H8F939_9SPHN|nr:cbb3-type cytochrome c oxidase subunit 3 [Sphingomonas gellani]SEN28242.1 cytochrome c oxidase cbb3-type subunit 4 [Sphingomonas gellani]